MVGWVCCSRQALAAAPSRETAAPPLESAAEVLEKMLAAYREADSYQDSGQVKLHFQRTGAKGDSAKENTRAKRGQPDGTDKTVDQTWDYSIAFERPNRLRMHIYQAVAVSDGKKLRTIGLDRSARPGAHGADAREAQN